MARDGNCNRGRIVEENFIGKSIVDIPNNFCVMSIETTDLNSSTDRITEIALRKFKYSKEIDSINFDKEINEDTLSLVDKFLEDYPVVINKTGFVVPFIGQAYINLLSKPFPNNVIDIQRLFKQLEKQNVARIDHMIEYFNLNTPHVLKATEDIKSVTKIYLELQNDFHSKKLKLKDIQPKNGKITLKEIIGDPKKNDPKNAFYKKNVSASGALTRYTRKEVGQLINDIGGTFQINPGKKTEYLILGNLKEKSSKLAKAQELGIKVIPEVEFMNMISNYKWL